MPKRMPLAQQRRRATDAIPPGTQHRGKGWYFERRLSLDTVVGILGFAAVIGAPLFYWAHALDGRVLAMEVREDERARAANTRDQEMRDFRKSVSDQFAQTTKQLTDVQITLGVLAGVRQATAAVAK